MSREDTPDQRRRRRLIITLTATGLVLAILAGIGIYGLVTGPRRSPTSDPTPTATSPASSSPSTPTTPSNTLRPLPVTTNPEAYARAVALALFDWNTYSLRTRDDHRQLLLDGADPSGREAPGLVQDLDGYLPSQETWRQLQEYRTAQHLEITQIVVPDAWAEALVVGGDVIAEGTVAYTIDGIRHRTGVWLGEPVSSEHAVAFTVFIACPPAFEQCRLLRLSVLDTPLR